MESSLFSNWKNKITHALVQAWKNVSLHRSKYITGIAIVCTLVFVAMIGQAYIKSQFNVVYHVKIDGKVLGTVDNKNIVDQWVKQKGEEQAKRFSQANVVLDNKVTFEEEKGFKLSFDNEASLSKLEKVVTYSSTAVEFKINGNLIGYVKDQQTLNSVLDSIKSQYVPMEAKKDSSVRVASISAQASTTVAASNDEQSQVIEEVKFVEAVEINQLKISPTEVLSAEELAKILNEAAVEKKVYNVVEGDCVGCIASKFDMSTKELLALNPGVSEDTLLQLNQEITVSAPKPKLTVQTVETLKYNEDIPYLTQYIEDNNLPKGQSKVHQEGKNGQRAVEAKVTKENGIEVSRELITQTVLSEPVVRIVKNGTKKVGRGSGTFAWPTVGGKITSTYGKRWGTTHKGIDIAGVKDRSIKAADNGKIISAGWSGSYGNCIVIDHGNGYTTRYAHLKSISKKSGTVEKGEVIGVMGSTGHSTGVHLHFEIEKNGKQINPLNLL